MDRQAQLAAMLASRIASTRPTGPVKYKICIALTLALLCSAALVTGHLLTANKTLAADLQHAESMLIHRPIFDTFDIIPAAVTSCQGLTQTIAGRTICAHITTQGDI